MSAQLSVTVGCNKNRSGAVQDARERQQRSAVTQSGQQPCFVPSSSSALGRSVRQVFVCSVHARGTWPQHSATNNQQRTPRSEDATRMGAPTGVPNAICVGLVLASCGFKVHSAGRQASAAMPVAQLRHCRPRSPRRLGRLERREAATTV